MSSKKNEDVFHYSSENVEDEFDRWFSEDFIMIGVLYCWSRKARYRKRKGFRVDRI